MVNKLTKTMAAVIFAGLIALVGAVFAYTDMTTISAAINGEVKDTLSANNDSATTTISTTGTVIHDGLAIIGNEVVDVTAGGGTNSLTVTRAQNGTTADSHSEGDVIRQLTQNVDVVFTPDGANYDLGDKVIVYIPNHSPNSFGSMAGVTATITDTDATFGAATYDTDARTITFEVTTAGATAETTVAISNLIMPNKIGQYVLPVEIRSASDTLKEMGDALLAWANQVRVRAIIQPALIFTIDKTNIDITANPSVNDGENYAQRSVLSVATNAVNGYTIYGMLEGKNTPANAQLDNASNSIAVGDSSSAENTFGYYAWDNDVVKTGAEVKAQTGKAFDNNSEAAPSFTDVADANVGFNTFTNDHKHTVYYGLNVDYTTPSGEYEGLVTYTATPSF